MRYCLTVFALLATSFLCQAEPISFPTGYVPFSFIDYMTLPDSDGVRLVVGEVGSSNARANLLSYLAALPPVTGNQQYVGGPIELAPGLFFNDVLVPTVAERAGDFESFREPIYDPITGALFSLGIGCAPPPPFTLVPGSNDLSFSAGCPTNLLEFSWPFPGNYIPLTRLGSPFAFLLGPSQQTDPVVPEPASIYLIGIALGVALLFVLRNKTEPRPEEEAVATSSISSSDPATIKY